MKALRPIHPGSRWQQQERTGIRCLLMCYLLILFTLTAAPVAAATDILQTVPRVDLERYLGNWYELARIPNRFQDHCAGDVTAGYSRLEDGRIQVVNRCRDKNGTMDEAKGVARVVDPASNAKLEVSFVSLFGWRLFWGDYWILELDQDYRFALIGTPSRKFAWVLSRSVKLHEQDWARIDRALERAGYAPRDLQRTPQKRGRRE